MAVPQNGIFAFGTSAHGYFELDLAPGAVAADVVAAVADHLLSETSMQAVNLVAGFRPELWGEVVPGRMPTEVTGFTEP